MTGTFNWSESDHNEDLNSDNATIRKRPPSNMDHPQRTRDNKTQSLDTDIRPLHSAGEKRVRTGLKRRTISIKDLVHANNVNVSLWKDIAAVASKETTWIPKTSDAGIQETQQVRFNWMPPRSTSSTSSTSKTSKTSKTFSSTIPTQSDSIRKDFRVCSHCGATDTPSWRRNIFGALLCNACGLYEKIHQRPRIAPLQDGKTRVRRKPSMELQSRKCANCATDKTPMWRKIESTCYCNACAIFFRANKAHRPRSDSAAKLPPEPPL